MSRAASRRAAIPPLTVLAIAALAPCTSPGSRGEGASEAGTFAQISDVHLFDEGAPLPSRPAPGTGWRTNEQALDWALERIAKIDGLKFIVFTGDLGLEMVGPYLEAQAVEGFAARLERLPVRSIFFVPGNNDLLNEEPYDIGRYRQFVRRLQERLPSKDVLDLTQPPRGGLREFDGVFVHGLDSSTFKNSIPCFISFKKPPPGNRVEDDEWWIVGLVDPSKSPAPAPDGASSDAPAEFVQAIWCRKSGISARMTAQEQEMKRLAEEIRKYRKAGSRHLVFTHIPPLDDPHPFWRKRKEEQATTQKTEEELEKPLQHVLGSEQDAAKRIVPWNRKIHPRPWNLQPATRRLWLTEIAPKVDCVLAGHFHSSNRETYGAGSTGGSCQRRIVVAPPLAIKFQDHLPNDERSRGYLVGTVTPADVKVEVVFIGADE